MKILLLSYMDNLGAGNAASKIFNMLKKNNINVDFFVKNKTNLDHKKFIFNNFKESLHEKIFDGLNYLTNKLINNKFSTKTYKSLSWFKSPYVKVINNSNYDIVQLHWINNFLSIEDISNIKKKMIWRFSDMWPFQGIKHYTENEKKNVGKEFNFIEILEKYNLNKKKKLWKKKINIITPSLWLKKLVEKSELMSNWPVETIYTPIDVNIFKPLVKEEIKDLQKHPKNNVMIFGADNLLDKRKGLEDILNIFKNKIINQKKSFDLIIFGNGNINLNKINNLNIYNYGRINCKKKINELFNISELLLLPSKIDNLPQIGLEAQTSGLPILLYNNSGLSELIKENETGLLAKDQNLHSLATLIENFFEKNENERKKMRQNSRNRSIKCWSEEVIINKYISLYKKILLDN